MEKRGMLTSVSVSMGLLLLGIYIGRRSVKEKDNSKRVLVPDERRKKRAKVDIVDERRVDDDTDNYLGDLFGVKIDTDSLNPCFNGRYSQSYLR